MISSWNGKLSFVMCLKNLMFKKERLGIKDRIIELLDKKFNYDFKENKMLFRLSALGFFKGHLYMDSLVLFENKQPNM